MKNSPSAPDKATPIQRGVISRRDLTGDTSQDITKRKGKRKQDEQRTDEENPLEEELLQQTIQFQSNIFKEMKKT